MIIEIVIGGVVLGFFFRWLQDRASKNTEKVINKIAELTQQKATAEQQKKAFECQRIIKSLQDIQEEELRLETYLGGYKVEEPPNETKLFEIKLFGHSLENFANNSINIMYDATGQLSSSLKDNALRNDLLNYLRRFYVLPDRILKHNFPEQNHQRENLLNVINEQTGEIQKFIERFEKEMDSSLAEKREENQSVTSEILNHRKYFNAPKL